MRNITYIQVVSQKMVRCIYHCGKEKCWSNSGILVGSRVFVGPGRCMIGRAHGIDRNPVTIFEANAYTIAERRNVVQILERLWVPAAV